ncbi:uncharacterized protein LOC103278380 isoform X1 [Anolis carolinensis]|uniref:uncharacterized protein LOC103278380 isoform X1 n=2 Tax=Anolis carolinensis TaxID=28377 RepID=UPI002F2B73E7
MGQPVQPPARKQEMIMQVYSFDSMPPRKNVGGTKAKGPAKQKQPKRSPCPTVPENGSLDAAAVPPTPVATNQAVTVVPTETLNAMWATLQVLEQERRAPPPNLDSEQAFNTLISHVSALENKRSAPGTGDGGQPNIQPADPVPSAEPTAVTQPEMTAQTQNTRSSGGSSRNDDTPTWPWDQQGSQESSQVQNQLEELPASLTPMPTHSQAQGSRQPNSSGSTGTSGSSAINDKQNQYWGTEKWPVALPPMRAVRLGSHLNQRSINKMLRNKYVDIFSLHFKDMDKKEKDELDEEYNERMKKRKVDNTWDNWLACYMIYAGVIVRKYPASGPFSIPVSIPEHHIFCPR